MEKNQIITFGCRLNIYESEKIKQSLTEEDCKDFLVINTCAVTAEAERQARQAIRKAHREFPEKKIIVTGCSATVHPNMYTSLPEVYAVVPNSYKDHIPLYLNTLKQKIESLIIPQKKIASDFPMVSSFSSFFQLQKNQEDQPHPSLLYGFEGRARAFLQIQTGCDHCCSFCLIHVARGKSRCFPLDQIVQQARIFAENGYNEINLTGVDLCSFSSEGYNLGSLIQLLLKELPSHIRLRLSSLDPAVIDDDLLQAFSHPRLSPHCHLSLQSGDATILRRMLRRHTPEQASQTIARLRSVRPDIIFGADIICGFPTETEEMFENTYQFIQQNQIALLHVFPYSDRPGTVASVMKEKIPKKIAKDRTSTLRLLGRQNLLSFMQTIVGKETEVLIEKTELVDSQWRAYGKTAHFLPVKILCNRNDRQNESKNESALEPGRLITVRIEGLEKDTPTLLAKG